MVKIARWALGLTLGIGLAGGMWGQSLAVDPTLPPPTKLEGFQPSPGSILTVGHDDLGNVNGVSVDLREMRGVRGPAVRGLVVEMVGGERGAVRSFVDADEVGALVKGCDALLQVSSNPTQFSKFEVRYTTRGSLELIAAPGQGGGISYTVRVGRFETAARSLGAPDLQMLRDMFSTAAQKLASLPD